MKEFFLWFLAADGFKNYSKHTDWRIHKINYNIQYNPVVQTTFMSVIVLCVPDLQSLQAGHEVTIFHSSFLLYQAPFLWKPGV